MVMELGLACRACWSHFSEPYILMHGDYLTRPRSGALENGGGMFLV